MKPDEPAGRLAAVAVERTPMDGDLTGLGRDTRLNAIPTLLALSVGLLYAVGAVVKVGQLRAADVTVRDVLVLFPIQQLLATGISVLLVQFVFVLFLGAAYLGLVYFAGYTDRTLEEKHEKEDREREQKREEWKKRLQEALDAKDLDAARAITKEAESEVASLTTRLEYWRRNVILAAVAGGIIFGCFALLSTPVRAVGFGVVYALMVAYLFLPIQLRIAQVVAIVILVGLAFTLLDEFYSPNPLPVAAITTADGEDVAGRLVLATDSTWYVQTDDASVRAVDVGVIQDSSMMSEEPSSDETILGILKRKF